MNYLRMKILSLIALAGMWAPVNSIAVPYPQIDDSPAAQKTDLQSQLAAADDVLKEMSKTTGLPIKGPLRKAILPRPAIEKYLKENLHAEYTPEELHVQEAMLKAFGLVPNDFNLEEFLLTLYTEQVAGFYDPRTKTMNMADWIPSEMQSMVLAHELTHALQDQNFDLEKFLNAVRDNDDATSARQAVAEGYAMAAMMQHALGVDLGTARSLSPMMAELADQQMGAFPAFSKAPFFFRLQALFPYLQGMTFMQKGLARGGWKELNTMFANPPASTKELFDPDFYFEHKPLPQVSLPQPGALANVASLHWLSENTMGELGYYGLIAQLTSEDEAKPVAMAWLADRYMVYEYSGKASGDAKYAVVARTKWMDAEKSLGFFNLYHTILEKKYPGLTPDARSAGDLFIGSLSENRVVLLRRGDQVLWAEGIPAAQTDGMLEYFKSLMP